MTEPGKMERGIGPLRLQRRQQKYDMECLVITRLENQLKLDEELAEQANDGPLDQTIKRDRVKADQKSCRIRKLARDVEGAAIAVEKARYDRGRKQEERRVEALSVPQSSDQYVETADGDIIIKREAMPMPEMSQSTASAAGHSYSPPGQLPPPTPHMIRRGPVTGLPNLASASTPPRQFHNQFPLFAGHSAFTQQKAPAVPPFVRNQDLPASGEVEFASRYVSCVKLHRQCDHTKENSEEARETEKARNKRSYTKFDLEFYQYVLTRLQQSSDDFVKPFLEPVDLSIAPHYYTIISKPIALSDIQHKLNQKIYTTAEQFIADFELMFTNCKTYNAEDDLVYEHGEQLRNAFETCWQSRDFWIFNKINPPAHTKPRKRKQSKLPGPEGSTGVSSQARVFPQDNRLLFDLTGGNKDENEELPPRTLRSGAKRSAPLRFPAS